MEMESAYREYTDFFSLQDLIRATNLLYLCIFKGNTSVTFAHLIHIITIYLQALWALAKLPISVYKLKVVAFNLNIYHTRVHSKTCRLFELEKPHIIKVAMNCNGSLHQFEHYNIWSAKESI